MKNTSKPLRARVGTPSWLSQMYLLTNATVLLVEDLHRQVSDVLRIMLNEADIDVDSTSATTAPG